MSPYHLPDFETAFQRDAFQVDIHNPDVDPISQLAFQIAITHYRPEKRLPKGVHPLVDDEDFRDLSKMFLEVRGKRELN